MQRSSLEFNWNSTLSLEFNIVIQLHPGRCWCQPLVIIIYIIIITIIIIIIIAAVNGGRTPALTHDAVVTLYDAVLSNPTIEPVVRGMLYSSLSAYYANQKSRYADAAALAIKATEAAPDQAAFNISFAKLLIVLRQFGAAREQLQIARTKTLDNELLETIKDTELMLEGAQ